MAYRIFLLLFILALILSFLLIKSPEREARVKEKHTGLIYKSSWNKDDEYSFKTRAYKVLIKGTFSRDFKEVVASGAYVEIDCRLEIPRQATNPGEFNYDNYLLAKKVYYLSYVKEADIKIVDKSPLSFDAIASIIRHKIEKSLGKYFKKDDYSLVLAIMVGDSHLLDDELKTNISLSGISHLLAVSGSHVFMFLFPFEVLLKNKLFGLRLRKVLLIIPLLFFTLVTGASPSVVRAGFFMILKIIGLAFNKKIDSINLLSLIALVQLILNPYSIYDISYILTYASAFSIVIICPVLKKYFYSKGLSYYKKGDGRGRGQGAYEKSKILSLNFKSLLIGLGVNLGILPIMVNYFNRINIIGLFVTLLASPIASIILISAYLLSLLDNIGLGTIARLISYFLRFFIFILKQIINKASFMPSFFTNISLPSKGLTLYLVYYFILFIVLYKLSGKKFKGNIKEKMILGLIAILFIINTSSSILIFYDVGQGNSFYIESKYGKKGLIDTGEGFTDMSLLLLKNGVSKLDFIIISHGHLDHYGDIYNIIENHKVDKLFLPKNGNDHELNKLGHIAEDLGIKVYYVENYLGYRVDKSMKIDIFVNIDNMSLNNSSLVVKLQMEEVKLLFTGDIEEEAEAYYLSKKLIDKCNILQIAHHGSNTSSTQDFLHAANPDLALIPVGRNNKYGHPDKEVLERLENIKVYRTDLDGAIIVKIKGIRYRAITYL